jgi:hypothetical protein
MDLTFLAHLLTAALMIMGLSAAVRFFVWLSR